MFSSSAVFASRRAIWRRSRSPTALPNTRRRLAKKTSRSGNRRRTVYPAFILRNRSATLHAGGGVADAARTSAWFMDLSQTIHGGPKSRRWNYLSMRSYRSGWIDFLYSRFCVAILRIVWYDIFGYISNAKLDLLECYRFKIINNDIC